MANIIIKKEGKTLDEGNIHLWQVRIKSHLEWIKEYWNGWSSWKASYLLDRAIHWGEAKALLDKSQDANAQVTIPIIATHIRNLMPFLFSKDPVYYGFPKKVELPEDLENTKAQIDYINTVWDEYKMSKQAKRSILDAAIIGHGIAKTGWSVNLDLPKTGDPVKEGNINYLDYLRDENPFVRRINPFLFLFDRMAPDSDLESARWCCEFVIKTIQDLLDDDSYDKKVRKNIGIGSVPIMKVREFNTKYHDSSDENQDFLFKNEESTNIENVLPDSLCILYKIYDRKYGNIFTLIPGYDEEVLEVHKWEDFYSHLLNFPFVKVDFEDVPNEIYGTGHSRNLADLQHQINRNRSKIFAITRMFNPKYTYKGSEGLKPGTQEKINSDIPGEVVDLPVDGNIENFPTPTVAQDLYRAANLLSSDYSEISGEDILARGGLLPSRTSAEEVRQRTRLRGLRLESNVTATHEFLLTLADQVLRHAKRFVTRDKIVTIVGRPGQFWGKVTPEQIRNGDTRLKLEVISKDPNPPEVKQRKLLEVFQIVANPNIYQLLQSQGVQINMKRLWKELMDTFNIDELQYIFPDMLQDDSSLPDISLFNTGNQVSSNGGNPSTNEIQSDNVQEQSFGQGFEGIFNIPRG